MSGRPLYPNNDDEPVYYVERRNTATGEWEPATGLAALTVRLSATDGGAAIHANLSKAATERTEAPGYYYARFEGDDIATHLATYAHVYQVFGDGVNIHRSDHRRVFPHARAAA